MYSSWCKYLSQVFDIKRDSSNCFKTSCLMFLERAEMASHKRSSGANLLSAKLQGAEVNEKGTGVQTVEFQGSGF